LDVSAIRKEVLGAQTAAAYAGSRFGIAVKVSQDGDVLVVHKGEVLIENESAARIRCTFIIYIASALLLSCRQEQ
jgi:hypothetical protein